MNSSVSEDLDEAPSVFGGVSGGLIEHDHTTDVLINVGSCKEQLSIGLSVRMVVLHINAGKSFPDCTS